MGDFHADVGNFLYDFQIVGGIVVRAFGIICHVEFSAQVAVVGVRHERAVTWGMQGEYPTFHTFFLRCLCGGINGGERDAYLKFCHTLQKRIRKWMKQDQHL